MKRLACGIGVFGALSAVVLTLAWTGHAASNEEEQEPPCIRYAGNCLPPGMFSGAYARLLP